MKILALNGSYRTNGNTARVLSLIEEPIRCEADRAGETLDFETVDLGHMNIQMCRGCRICFDRGEDHCPLKDDLLAVKKKMKEADSVIIASPVYVDDVSGITKNWIDRLAHVCHRPEFFGKYAYLLATTGATSTGHTLRTMNALMYWGFHIIGRAGFKTGALSKRDEINARYGKKIDQSRGPSSTQPNMRLLLPSSPSWSSRSNRLAGESRITTRLTFDTGKATDGSTLSESSIRINAQAGLR